MNGYFRDIGSSYIEFQECDDLDDVFSCVSEVVNLDSLPVTRKLRFPRYSGESYPSFSDWVDITLDDLELSAANITFTTPKREGGLNATFDVADGPRGPNATFPVGPKGLDATFNVGKKATPCRPGMVNVGCQADMSPTIGFMVREMFRAMVPSCVLRLFS